MKKVRPRGKEYAQQRDQAMYAKTWRWSAKRPLLCIRNKAGFITCLSKINLSLQDTVVLSKAQGWAYSVELRKWWTFAPGVFKDWSPLSREALFAADWLIFRNSEPSLIGWLAFSEAPMGAGGDGLIKQIEENFWCLLLIMVAKESISRFLGRGELLYPQWCVH